MLNVLSFFFFMCIFAKFLESNGKMMRFGTLMLAFFLGILAYAQEADEVLMTVGGKPVWLQDFLYAYQKNGSATDMDSFLASYEDYRVKVTYAEKQGLDTLSGVRQRLDYFQKCLEAGQQGVDSRKNDGGLQGTSLYIGHLVLPLPQHAPSAGYQYTLKVRMDSIYQRIQAGEDFLKVVNAVSPRTRNLYWVSRNHLLADVEKVAYGLSEGEVCAPFLSTDGYHLIKLFRKSTMGEEILLEAQNAPQEVDGRLLAEYRDGLLLSELYRTEGPVELEPTQENLEAWFKEHESDYSWDIPHYKGVIYHCKDKKTLKQVAKLFKKYPMEEWNQMVQSPAFSKIFQKAQVGEVTLYKLSQDPYVDELAFGGPKQKAVPEYPFTGISGKKLKKGPETYKDLEAQVQTDFLNSQEDTWVKTMRESTPVWLNQKVYQKLGNN